jgi:hypothetical protein
VLIEGTFGIWFKPYDGSREKVNRGCIQWGPQFSYVHRNTWSGVGRAARAGWNDLYFVPLLLTVACASLTPSDCSLLLRGGEDFYCSHRSE